MGYRGSERTTKRVVAEAKAAWHASIPAIAPSREWGALRLRRRAADRRDGDHLVLHVAGVVALPGGVVPAGQVVVERGRRVRHSAAQDGRGAGAGPPELGRSFMDQFDPEHRMAPRTGHRRRITRHRPPFFPDPFA